MSIDPAPSRLDTRLPRLTRLNTTPQSAPLPEPEPAARAASAALCQHIAEQIVAAGGWISFARYMALALYAPGLGYYSGGAQKFGAAGDFITAPEISPLFAHSLATPAVWVMQHSAPHILEVGAGSGLLAVDLLAELERLGQLPERYAILEVSGELRARQQATAQSRIPHLYERMVWLDHLPEKFSGFVLGNEVLDAMPVELVEWHAEGMLQERGIALDEHGQFCWFNRPATGRLREAAQQLDLQGVFPYVCEIGLIARAWVAEWSQHLEQGALLLIDYGFPRHEYYLPQRNNGTLMCHYRHHAHDNPLWWPGLNDITTHVDFSAIADAGFNAGLDVLGYTHQAQFLLNCGITTALARLADAGETRHRAYLSAVRNVEKLILPHEMGELFKVIAFGRKIPPTLPGFQSGDRLHTL
ncbi:MAG: SAM-dependent methyltransferase [Sterolibacterium sp.]|jgi:SAM-dependent MidA family methyltransferase|nr:SAM-dependent methyltransferase [Sterolibacterium sp.]